MTKILKHYYTLFFLLPFLVHAQIKITPLKANQSQNLDRLLFGASDNRSVFLINEGWKVYADPEDLQKISTSVPVTFEGDDILYFEKRIDFTKQQIENHDIRLGFLGINYSAEISVNGNSIYNHYGGSYPFEVSLPYDLLRPDASNKITIKITKKLDSEHTFPAKQRFLFPDFGGGIIRDAYIKIVPHLSVSKIDFNYSLDQLSLGRVNFNVQIKNSTTPNEINRQTQFIVHVNLIAPGSGVVQAKGDFAQTIYNQENYDARFQLDIINPSLWSPASPNLYLCEVSIVKDGTVIDKQIREISFFQLKKTQSDFILNGVPFSLSGTTYFLNETLKRQTNIYDKIKEDLTFIKHTGFNAVRFAKSYPHPYALQVCQELGLFALIEFPINSVPEEFISQNEFQLKASGFLREFTSNYYNYSNTLLIGAGGGYIPNSSATENFISKIMLEIRKKNLLTFASFSGWQKQSIENLDLYGFEIFSVPIDNLNAELEQVTSSLGKNSVFFSEVTYPNYKGNATGYLVRNSKEAQAKYFENIFNLTQKEKLSGFFINTLLKYQGSFISLYSSNIQDQYYNFSVLDFSKNTNSIAYKLLISKLNNGSKVTIPIGSRKDDNPIIFILIALALSVIMAVLINTKRKFREDATRALLRPYNFFSDIRDHRILSGIHTTILMLIIAAAASLLVTILLFYLRDDLLFEKLLLSFASTRLMRAVSFLAWNPQICFVILFIVAVVKFALLTLIMKFGSFFVKTRIPLANIFYTVVWAFLPLTLFLPIELVLYKVLMMSSLNTIMFLILVLFFLWLLFRLLKGIYVVFDVRPLFVYAYSIMFIFLLLGGILLKYQLTHSIIYYVSNAVAQYNSMIN